MSGEGAGRSSEEDMAAVMAMVGRNSADVYVWVAISQYWLSMPLSRSSIDCDLIRQHEYRSAQVEEKQTGNYPGDYVRQVVPTYINTRPDVREVHYASLQQAAAAPRPGGIYACVFSSLVHASCSSHSLRRHGRRLGRSCVPHAWSTTLPINDAAWYCPSL